MPAQTAEGAGGPADVEELDVLIIGAGLSGINSAYRLRETFPDVRYAILERREVTGGTWSFWKFPGIRSDSTLALFGLPWHPWPHGTDFASAELINEYIADAAASQGIDKHIRLGHDVQDFSWSSEEQRWTLTVKVRAAGGQTVVRLFKASWVFMCSGYYDYDSPRKAEIPGLDKFAGQVVHPQFWDPEKVNYRGKRVVIVGSGATAVTLFPSLAEEASHVTMLQRSPSYVLALPSRDSWTTRLRNWLGHDIGGRIDWWRRILLEFLFVQFLLNFPNAGRRVITKEAKRRLPKDYPVDVHFNPRYNPFEQRLCFCPNADFFKALSQPNCEVVTATIETCDTYGIRLQPGQQPNGEHNYKPPARIDADIIVTATGLHMQLLGGRVPIIDGVPHPVNERYVWRSCMLDGIPNACAIMGYTAGTWTPGADVHVKTALKVMKQQRKLGATSVVPHIEPSEREQMPKLPVMPNNSTYILEGNARMPMSAGRDPWRNGQNWWADSLALWFRNVTTGLRYNVPAAKRKSI
ncbi:monooxygenase [Magnaporthiopsis poae ATCC 64411]|uniref:Monooxygenase n=1 Tax=Magnaporthiopsis poae (strain ATCC 64411 / 73-15) TaxID=644358 RepID=A0A0C4DN38_MAGP6|nr:monooxygenase [Magnaporthiopsis poae ATCC 64411]